MMVDWRGLNSAQFWNIHKFWGAKRVLASHHSTLLSVKAILGLNPQGQTPSNTEESGVLCITALDGYPLHSGQHPLYSVGNPYICATAIHEPGYSSLLSLTLLTSTFCFQLTFAHAQAEPPEPRHRLICNRQSITLCVKKLGPPCVSSLWRQVMECGGNRRQWRFQMETKCHSETIRVPLRKMYLNTH